MPRRHRRKPEVEAQSTRTPRTTTPIGAPAGWIAQLYHGGPAGADYTCPRCLKGVGRQSQHVVAWPEDDGDRRRHWHTNCWQAAVREGIDRFRWS